MICLGDVLMSLDANYEMSQHTMHMPHQGNGASSNLRFSPQMGPFKFVKAISLGDDYCSTKMTTAFSNNN
jgi:hypothetical protein